MIPIALSESISIPLIVLAFLAPMSVGFVMDKALLRSWRRTLKLEFENGFVSFTPGTHDGFDADSMILPNSILPFRLDELKREMMKGQLEKAKVLAEQAVSMMRETVLKKKQKEEQEGGAVSNTLISV